MGQRARSGGTGKESGFSEIDQRTQSRSVTVQASDTREDTRRPSMPSVAAIYIDVTFVHLTIFVLSFDEGKVTWPIGAIPPRYCRSLS